MKETLQVINEMQQAGVIGKYAIGGAVGAALYIEAASTYDIDIFIPFQKTDSPIVSLNHLYDYLLPRGCKAAGAHIIIKGWQVQFLPAEDALYNEALEQAVEVDIEGTKTWVMTAEHLMAICLRTGRTKDFTRLEQFVNRTPSITAGSSAPLKSAESLVGAASNGPANRTIVLSQNKLKIYDENRLHEILERHGLTERWKKFKLDHNISNE